MCGICGIYNFPQNPGPPVDKALVERMCKKIAHRGPDDSGVFVGGSIGLGNRRLSIIDLSKGHQPIFNEDGSAVIVYNGEVYNFAEIRKNLKERGHVFTTDTDTEVILHAYEEYGIECVQHFNGMFAFAIWDDKKRRLFLARDRLGIKPLFYSAQNGSITFGSEIKCILESNKIDRRINFQALDYYFSLGYIPAPHTIFKGIQKLHPGHFMTCDKNGINIRRYWDVEFNRKKNRREEDLYAEFIELLRKSIKLRLISDVPLGAFLSGGTDSSLIVAIMSEVADIAPRTFSIGFDDALCDESPYSTLVAHTFQTVHQNYIVKADVRDVLDHIVESFDEPFADDGAIPCYHVCRETRREVKVALSGLGGDELFGGYPRYVGFELGGYLDKLPFLKNRFLKKLVKLIPEPGNGGYNIDRAKRFFEGLPLESDERYLSFLSLLDAQERQNLYSEQVRNQIDFEKNSFEITGYLRYAKAHLSLDRIFYMDHHTYLPDDILALTDRISMWHSLEVRVPFLDHNLVEFAASLPPETKIRRLVMKYFLKRAAKGILPSTILKKRKQGFVGPLPLWLMRDLKDYTMEVLSEHNLKRHGLFNYEMIKQVLVEHMSRKRKHDTLIWALLVFERWHQQYMD